MDYKRLTLEEFTEIYHKVPRAAVDLILRNENGILLTKRAIPPYKGMWHIPGGTVLFQEPINHAIKRIAKNELGVEVEIIKHLDVIEYYEEDGRHTISNVYLVDKKEGELKGGDQGKEWRFFQKAPENCIPLQKEFLEKLY